MRKRLTSLILLLTIFVSSCTPSEPENAVLRKEVGDGKGFTPELSVTTVLQMLERGENPVEFAMVCIDFLEKSYGDIEISWTLPDGRVEKLSLSEIKSACVSPTGELIYEEVEGIEGMFSNPTSLGITEDGFNLSMDEHRKMVHGAELVLPDGTVVILGEPNLVFSDRLIVESMAPPKIVPPPPPAGHGYKRYPFSLEI